MSAAAEKTSILIIEDSPNVAVLIQDFLKKLGYKKIQICKTGRDGIVTFKSLIKKVKTPLVFLDYNLPDMNGNEIMKELILLRPDVKIIISTADQETDESIRDTMRSGARAYLEKPIRLQNLKEIMSVLEEEEKILDERHHDTSQRLQEVLQEYTQISLARIAEYCNTQIDDAMDTLKRFEAEGKIRPANDIREASCNVCGSLRIRQEFYCPYCKKTNFKQGKLIEHFSCGNFSIEESYKNNICPKCRKEIKIFGVDYRTVDNYYVCDDCNNKFPTLEQENVCLKCNNKFKIEQAKWISSRGYVVIRPQ